MGPPPPRTWYQWLWGVQPVSTTYENTSYHPEEGLIAIGSDVWNQVILGLNEGSLGTRPTPEQIAKNEADNQKESFKDTETPSENKNDDKQVTKKEIEILLSQDNLPPNFSLPTLGYISGDHEIGFFARMYDFFNSRLTIDHVGLAALNIALGNEKTFSTNQDVVDDKEEKTLQGLDERLVSRISYYVAPKEKSN